MSLSEVLKVSKMKFTQNFPAESPLCCVSCDLADLAIPNDKTTSNHFGILGSSPLGSRDGSLSINVKNDIYLRLKMRY